ncbi:MAG: hypothetical protein Q9220_002136 [cf. Caloplaca sp. 1 TL-2023]
MFIYIFQLLLQALQISAKKVPLLDQSDLLARYQNASSRLFLFDYDGTLTPIVRDPKKALPTAATIRTLERISADPLNEFWIISGRDARFLDQHLGFIQSIGLSAEHGAFVRRPNTKQWENISASGDMSWHADILLILSDFVRRTHGSWIERKDVAITWHYRNAPVEEGAKQATECKKRLEEKISQLSSKLEVMNGKMVLEVRPKGLNKGALAQQIIDDYTNSQGERKSPELILCVGDDVTDEGEIHIPTNHREQVLTHIQICSKRSIVPVRLRTEPSLFPSVRRLRPRQHLGTCQTQETSLLCSTSLHQLRMNSTKSYDVRVKLPIRIVRGIFKTPIRS